MPLRPHCCVPLVNAGNPEGEDANPMLALKGDIALVSENRCEIELPANRAAHPPRNVWVVYNFVGEAWIGGAPNQPSR